MSLSATVDLDRTVLFEVTEDPNVTPRYVVAGTAGDTGGSAPKADAVTQDGGFRTYGNGNVRLILGTAQTRTQTLVLRALSAADLQTVSDLLGHTICYRDTYGRRIFGAYLSMTSTAIKGSGGLADVALVVQSVTYDEAV